MLTTVCYWQQDLFDRTGCRKQTSTVSVNYSLLLLTHCWCLWKQSADPWTWLNNLTDNQHYSFHELMLRLALLQPVTAHHSCGAKTRRHAKQVYIKPKESAQTLPHVTTAGNVVGVPGAKQRSATDRRSHVYSYQTFMLIQVHVCH